MMDQIPIIDWHGGLQKAEGILRIPPDFDMWNITEELERLEPAAILPPIGEPNYLARTVSMLHDQGGDTPILVPLTGKPRRARDLYKLFVEGGYKNFICRARLEDVPAWHLFGFSAPEWWHLAGVDDLLSEKYGIAGAAGARVTWSREDL